MAIATPRKRPPAPPAADPVSAYARAVLDGKVVAGRLVRLACERHFADLRTGASRGLRFDAETAEVSIDFFRFLKHTKGEWAGAVFELAPWQKFIVGSLFGWQAAYRQCQVCEQWLRSHGLSVRRAYCDNCRQDVELGEAVAWWRRFNTAHIEVARKNGKTTLLAGLGLLLAFFDGEAGAEVYAAATKRDQAKICWGQARRMARATEALRERLQILVNNLNDPQTGSKFEPLGADSDSLDGLDIHAAIVDELHAHKNRKMVDVLETATGARRQPLIVYITTAGVDRLSVCWEMHEYGAKLLEGVIPDDTFFVFIASIDEDDDWTDPANWPKANPNLGTSVKIEDLRRKCEKAKRIPGQQNAFKRLHGGLWTEQENRWLDVGEYDACADGAAREELAGERCFAGLDLSTTKDLTALELVFPEESGHEDLLGFYWVPEETVRQRSEEDKVPYDVWVEQGHIEATAGNVVDYDVIRRRLNELAEEFNIAEIGIDRWNSTQLQTQLMGDGFKVVPVGQGYASMNAPAKEIERRILDRTVHHDGNPVRKWAASNVALEQDAAGNIKPSKAKSTERIDPITAWAMAEDCAMRYTEETPTGVSVYVPGEEDE